MPDAETLNAVRQHVTKSIRSLHIRLAQLEANLAILNDFTTQLAKRLPRSSSIERIAEQPEDGTDAPAARPPTPATDRRTKIERPGLEDDADYPEFHLGATTPLTRSP